MQGLQARKGHPSNASDHLPAGAIARAIHWVHTFGERDRCIASLEWTKADTIEMPNAIRMLIKTFAILVHRLSVRIDLACG